MDFFRKMSFADSTGDAIPFYHEGKYHIFSLTSPPGTTVYPARLRTTWSHWCTGRSCRQHCIRARVMSRMRPACGRDRLSTAKENITHSIRVTA